MENPGSVPDRLLKAIWPRQLAEHVSRLERWTVALAVLVGAGILGFLALADAVADGGARRFDEWLLVQREQLHTQAIATKPKSISKAPSHDSLKSRLLGAK